MTRKRAERSEKKKKKKKKKKEVLSFGDALAKLIPCNRVSLEKLIVATQMAQCCFHKSTP